MGSRATCSHQMQKRVLPVMHDFHSSESRQYVYSVPQPDWWSSPRYNRTQACRQQQLLLAAAGKVGREAKRVGKDGKDGKTKVAWSVTERDTIRSARVFPRKDWCSLNRTALFLSPIRQSSSSAKLTA
jgi:hypothetical protein